MPVAEAPGGPGVAVAAPFSPDALNPATPPPEHFLTAFRWMLLARVLEEKLAGLYRAGKIQGGVYLGTGQEALSASLGVHLRKGDVFAPLIRDLAGRLAFGEDPLDVTRTYLGSPQGPMRGRDGNIHRGRPREGMLAMISHLGAMIPVVNGTLIARRLRGELAGVVGATCLGDGGTSTGAFHEGLNQAAVEKLPLVMVVANNQYAYSTPTTRQFGCADLLDRAVGYGVDGHAADGTDLTSCLTALGEAVSRARAGRGPQLVVAQLLRLTGHGAHDDAAYMDPALRASALGGDCVKLAAEKIVANGWAGQDEVETWRAEAVTRVETTVARTQRESAPDPAAEDWCALASRHLGC